ncbi:MAG: alpha-L-rhamnosidase N-terminal domain-containing protein [Clostridia bacterium]|nr:alpha-L-rhamnosidase N-terminal domain-containing protein [Clostridia bacterium]
MNTIKNAEFNKENADFGTVVPVFIKAIKPEKAIGKATLFCSALGSYEAYINGKRIGDFFCTGLDNLWQTPSWVWDNRNGNLQTLEVRAWMDELGVQKNYVAKDGSQLILL